MHEHGCTLQHPHPAYDHLCGECGAKYVTRYDSTEPTDPHTKPLDTSPEPVKSGLDSSHMDHANGSPDA